jgi:hypothetical protein
VLRSPSDEFDSESVSTVGILLLAAVWVGY